jgi:hypothetical protein
VKRKQKKKTDGAATRGGGEDRNSATGASSPLKKIARLSHAREESSEVKRSELEQLQRERKAKKMRREIAKGKANLKFKPPSTWGGRLDNHISLSSKASKRMPSLDSPGPKYNVLKTWTDPYPRIGKTKSGTWR